MTQKELLEVGITTANIKVCGPTQVEVLLANPSVYDHESGMPLSDAAAFHWYMSREDARALAQALIRVAGS